MVWYESTDWLLTNSIIHYHELPPTAEITSTGKNTSLKLCLASFHCLERIFLLIFFSTCPRFCPAVCWSWFVCKNTGKEGQWSTVPSFSRDTSPRDGPTYRTWLFSFLVLYISSNPLRPIGHWGRYKVAPSIFEHTNPPILHTLLHSHPPFQSSTQSLLAHHVVGPFLQEYYVKDDRGLML